MVARSRSFAVMLLLAVAFVAHPLGAQTSTHQRIGVEQKTILEISPSLNAEIYRVPSYDESALSGRASLRLGLLILSTLSVDVELPFSGRLFTQRDAYPRFVGALGDVSASIGTSFRLADWRLSLDASYSHPSGLFSYYEVTEKLIVSGSGYRSLGASFSAMRYLDPLAIGFRLRGETRLERYDRFGSSSLPAAYSLGLFVTESLNGEVALNASLTHGVAMPYLVNGIPDELGYSYSFSGSIGLVLSGSNASLSISVSKRLSEPAAPSAFSLSFSPTFRIKELKHEPPRP